MNRSLLRVHADIDSKHRKAQVILNSLARKRVQSNLTDLVSNLYPLLAETGLNLVLYIIVLPNSALNFSPIY